MFAAAFMFTRAWACAPAVMPATCNASCWLTMSLLHGKTDTYALRLLFVLCFNSLETGQQEQVGELAQLMSNRQR